MKNELINTVNASKVYIFDRNIYFEKRSSVSNMTELHYHHHYEIYYLLSGQQNYFIEDSYYAMKKGDCALIPKGTIHKTTNGMGGLRILLNFNDKFLNQYLSHRAVKMLLKTFETRIVRPTAEKAKVLIPYFEKINEASNNQDNDGLFLYLLKLLVTLQDCPTVEYKSDQAHPPLIHKITEYTQKNYDKITNLDDVANALYVSKYHICHLFTKHFDLPFNKYLTKVRLKNAEEKLLTTNLNVSEIAESCGFDTTTYFCYVFKKEFGISPLKYRNLFK
ncbi:MAG: helix-turn-helix domain-containing protein [Clostridia bacterium]|nr:helix-turn-helix domain-containing protein [Clostridia bacterium]